MLAALRNRFERWIASRHRAQSQPVRIERERLYIVPSGYGYFFGLTLFVLFLWSINYNNSMGFGLTFLLAAVALNAMWRCHNNLLGLVVHPADAEPVFAGQAASFVFTVENPDAQPRSSIALSWPAGPENYVDASARARVSASLSLEAPKRGWLRPPRLRLSTRFPLGLFRAWSWIVFVRSCLVYPKPSGGLPLPEPGAIATHGDVTTVNAQGSDDYVGLRGYVAGDSPRHIAWRASSRSEQLLVKRFASQSAPEIWLDWQALAPRPAEARLSQLCEWVLKAEQAGCEYGLRLPAVLFPPARGGDHRQRCLRALALFEIERLQSGPG